MKRAVIITIVVSACALFYLCSKQADNSFEQGLKLYDENRLEEALPYFQKAAEKEGSSMDYAYLAETYRRLNTRGKAVEAAEKSLDIDSCNSFAHTTLAYLTNPMFGDWEGADREKAWQHIKKGVECNPDDGNLWLAAWPEAIYRKDREMESKSLKMLIDTGFLTHSILAFNRWMLKDLPPNAILLTNGDMDTYPAVALQEKEGFRDDVVVMNYSLLNTRWYQDHIQNRYGVKFPFTDEELDSLKATKEENGRISTMASQVMSGLINAKSEGKIDRPIAISITVGDFGFARGFEDHFVLMGPYRLWFDKPAEINYDTDAIESSLKSLNINDFSGPFVSAMDRSPVRRVSTKTIATNFTNLATLVAKERLKQGHRDEALEMDQWAQRAERVAIREPQVATALEQLKNDILEGKSE
jgi:tetratricopeptide (TPR) repeat protein